MGLSWKEKEIHLTCKFDNSGTRLLYGGYSGSVFVRNIKKKKELKVSDNSPVTRIATFHGDKNTFFCSGNTQGDLVLYSMEKYNEVFRTVTLNKELDSIEVSKDNRVIITGFHEGTVTDIETQKKKREYSAGNMAMNGHSNKVCALKALDDYTSFVSAGWDKNLIVWDLRTNDAIHQFLAEKVAGDAIDFRGGRLYLG